MAKNQMQRQEIYSEDVGEMFVVKGLVKHSLTSNQKNDT